MKENKRTDKALLAKGVQRMAQSLIFIAISPVIIHSAFKNKEHSMYIPILIIGICGAIFAIFKIFQGIKTIMDALFEKE